MTSLLLYSNPKIKLNPSLNGSLLLNSDFADELDLLVEEAEKLGITLYINSGFRKDSSHLQGAIVPPAKMSNHFVGCAIDCNMIQKGVFYNSEMMATEKSDEIILLIKKWQEMGNRWGGHFATIDSVHFDNGLNVKNPDKWNELYLEYHTSQMA